jgi:hypothetical protein
VGQQGPTHIDYRGGVPVATKPWRWGLLAVLLLGLVLMHHVPGHPEHEAAHPAVAVSGLERGPGAAAPSCPCPADTPPAPALLHLCLAVAAAGVLVLVPLLRALQGPVAGAGAGGQAVRSVLGYLQPPPPVPRRLAALGVLRL